MGRSVERIDRDISELKLAIAAIADQLYHCYGQYLAALGQSVRQQLILASYYICTQSFPQAFLQLSFSQRQKLQQALLVVAKEAQHHLTQQLDPPGMTPLPPITAPLPVATEPEAFFNPEVAEAAPESADLPSKEIAELPELPQNTTPQPVTDPRELLQWQEHLEQAIAHTLRQVSLEVNRHLQQLEILPPRLPEPLLEMAVKTDAVTETVASPPNILDLTLDAIADLSSDKGDTEEISFLKALPLRIVAVHLRLAEIEFADATVKSWRNHIRSLSAQLSSLEGQYQRKQQERAIAAAEDAWRASWFDANALAENESRG
ncbi:hypothetical protein DO97_08725 [Neosynechococcus sphagnicola sy1]|uniref:Uncharacterized protein n=1 Tax=Neosynechococcus sphagnicola sy1 TaxID=1497020 RepID=A0A098TIQ9_9CYAN|nr:hypothetical protein [Neosynechococcus sphagnicola]KGF72445.1 hypothetical protein DO97_08725 [Neosynechococcus sphagnicola sy1]